MPELTGSIEVMKEVLLDLERIGIFSINLLEFCYPFINTETFNRNGFKLKKRPFKVLYNYWYAGGVPVSKSELLCLELVEFALDEGFEMGVHYCSLENKLTGQIFQQNASHPVPPRAHLSNKDFFLKSAKVYGEDIPKALKTFEHTGYTDYELNSEHNFVEFHLDQVTALGEPDIEVGVSYKVWETRDDGEYLRELKVDVTYPDQFDFARDV